MRPTSTLYEQHAVTLLSVYDEANLTCNIKINRRTRAVLQRYIIPQWGNYCKLWVGNILVGNVFFLMIHDVYYSYQAGLSCHSHLPLFYAHTLGSIFSPGMEPSPSTCVQLHCHTTLGFHCVLSYRKDTLVAFS